MSDKEEDIRIIKEFTPRLDEILSELDDREWTEEDEKQSRKMSQLSVEEMLQPFTI